MELKFFFKNFATVFSAGSISYIMLAIASPVLTRIFDPTQMGIYFSVISVSSIISTYSNLSLHNALPVAKTELETGKLYILALLLSLLLSSLSSSIIILLQLNSVFFFSDLPKYTTLLIFLLSVFTCWFLNSKGFFIRMKDYRNFGLLTILNMFQRISAQIGFGLIHKSAYILVLGELIGRISFIHVLHKDKYRLILKKSLTSFFNERFIKNIYLRIYRYRRFTIYTVPADLLETASMGILTPVTLAIYGPEIAGQFALALFLTALPQSIIGQSIVNVYLGHFSSNIINRDFYSAYKLHKIILFKIFPLIITLYLIMALIAPILVPVIFGGEWHMAGQIISLWVMVAALYFPVSILQRSLFSLNLHHYKLLFFGFLIFLQLLVILICWYLAVEFSLFVKFLAGGMVFAYLIYVLILHFSVKRLISVESMQVH